MLLVLYSSVFFFSFPFSFYFSKKACSKESFTQRTRFTSEMKTNKLHTHVAHHHHVSKSTRMSHTAVRAGVFERRGTHTPRFCNSPIYDTTPLILSGFCSIQTKRVRNYQHGKNYKLANQLYTTALVFCHTPLLRVVLQPKNLQIIYSHTLSLYP